MAKDSSRYIRFYTPGTAAVKVEIQDEQTWAPLPEQKPEKKLSIYVDPVAILGFVVAVSMLIMMAVGIHELNAVRREVVTLEHYVASLTEENQILEETYKAGYDPERIRRKALEMGMVPAEQIPQTRIYVVAAPTPAEEEETIWSQITEFLTDLFA